MAVSETTSQSLHNNDQPSAAPEPQHPRRDQNKTEKQGDDQSEDENQEEDNNTNEDESQGYVEKLMQYKLVDGKKFFLVKWQGSSVKTWEPEEHINADLIRQYHITRTQTGRARRRRTKSCFY